MKAFQSLNLQQQSKINIFSVFCKLLINVNVSLNGKKNGSSEFFGSICLTSVSCRIAHIYALSALKCQSTVSNTTLWSKNLPLLFSEYSVKTKRDATWYGGRPLPRRRCVRWRPSSPPQKRGHNSQFSAHVYCGQMAGCTRTPLGTEVGLGPGDIVFDGDPGPPERCTAPNCRPMTIVAKRLNGSRCHLVRR